MQHDELLREYEAAVAQERSAWTQARGKHVGGPDYVKAVWDQWVEAAAKVKNLAEQLRKMTP
jgi:hypothetical protein